MGCSEREALTFPLCPDWKQRFAGKYRCGLHSEIPVDFLTFNA
jgi:hypothetical protein